jgi:tetratricopeptide (TPR) repeat protein
MPSHTYYWVGRYQDAASVNARAVQIGIDQAKQLDLQQPDGLWGLPYHVHNITFGIGGALMAGDAATAMQLARPLVSMAATRTDEPFIRQVVASNGYYAFARFAEPAECLAVPEPKLPVLDASWHYMRGETFARLGRMADVAREAAAIKPVTGTFKREDGSIFAPGLIEIERAVLEGRAAMMTGKPAEALQKFEQAARVQEQGEFLAFADPPPFWYPVRRDVAAAKLALGDRRGARAELRRSLEIRKKDPEALAMLAKLEANTAAR